MPQETGGFGHSLVEPSIARLSTWPFWRTILIFSCLFSVVGHLVEYPYCWAGMTFFDSVDPESEVLANPFKPFFVYGIGFTLCCVLLEPLRDFLCKKAHRRRALILFYLISVFIGMAFELTQGFLQNQPVDGVYPLWDVHDHPGNILGQAWIVNDIFIGALITIFTWWMIPWCFRQAAKLSPHSANMLCLVIVVVTIILTVLTY